MGVGGRKAWIRGKWRLTAVLSKMVNGIALVGLAPAWKVGGEGVVDGLRILSLMISIKIFLPLVPCFFFW